MSTTIDERVVEMRFDNKHFEKNVETSISTVDKLNKSLDLKNASKGFENVDKAAKKVNLSGLTGAVETVSAKFSALQVMGVTALANLTNSAVNAGKRIVSAFTIDPVKTGFNEYELKMGSIQTIMAGTGESLETVNKYLEELNTYSDKTIYSFSDMTNNIGKFTNAGVKLDDAVAAIKGISNAAAIAGAGSGEASRAMYNFSQALSAGYVKLIDWKSIENANMATVSFKDELIKTAVELGVVTKAGDGMYKTLKGNTFNSVKNFNDVLQDQWMTSEVLVTTLRKYTDETTELGKKAYSAAQDVKTFSQMMDTLKESAQSGWAQSWEIIFGDFNEGKTLWTTINELVSGIIEKTSEARNTLLKGWKDAGGRDTLIGALFDNDAENDIFSLFEAISGVIKPIKEAFRDIFPPVTVEQLVKFTNGFKDLVAKMKLGDAQSEKLKSTFEGLFAILDIARMAFVAVWNAIKPFASVLLKIGDGILGITASWGDWLVNLRNTIKETDVFGRSLQKVVDFTKRTFETAKKYATIAIETIKEYVAIAIDVAVVYIEKLKTAFQTVKKYIVAAVNVAAAYIEKFKATFETVKGVVVSVAGKIKQFANTVKEKFVMPGFELFHNLLDRMNKRMVKVGETAGEMKSVVVLAFEAVGNAIKNSTFMKVLDALMKAIKIIAGGIAKALGALAKGFVDGIGNVNFDTIFDVITALSAGGIAIGIKKFLESITKPLEGLQGIINSFTDILDGFTGILDGVRGCFEAYQTQLKAGTLMKIASAIAILTASLLVLSLIDSGALNSAIGAITTLFAELLLSMKLFTSFTKGTKGVTSASTTMVAMSIAVLILAAALKTVSTLSTDELANGLYGITALTGAVVAAAKIMSSNTKKVLKGSISLIAFSLAVKILASVCKDLSALSWDEMKKGLVGVGVLLGEIALFLKMAKFSGKAVSTATGIVILAAAMKILASACGDFGSMSWGEIGKGLASIGALLAMLAAFTNLTGNAKHVVSTGIALVLIGASMKIFASAISDFASMSWEELGKGMAAFAGALAAVTIAVNFMPKDMVGKGVGLVAIAAAMTILASALSKSSEMSWESIGKGMVVLGGSLAILAIGLHAMNGTLAGSAALLVASAAILVLAPALSILGAMSWGSIIKGLITLAGAFTVLGVAGLVLSPLLPTIVGLSGAIALLGVGILAAAIGIEVFAIALGSLVAVGTAGAASLVAALTVVVTGVAAMIPAVIQRIGEGIVALLEVIIAATPKACEAIVVIVKSVLEALLELVPDIVETIFSLLTTVLTTLLNYTPTLVETVCNILVACLDGLAKNIGNVTKSAIDVVLAFIAGVAEKMPDIVQSGVDLLLSFLDGITNAIENNRDTMIEKMNNLILALLDTAIAVFENGPVLLKAAVKRLMDSGVMQAISEKFSDFKSKVKEFIDNAKSAITDKIEEWRDAGKDMIAGFIKGVKDKAQDIVDAAKGVVSGAVDSIKDFLGIKSPSRLFAEIGRYSDEGLISGLESLSGKVASSAAGVGEGAAEAMSSTLANISDIINDEMDTGPVIRPVLDLSNVESGTKSINAMFSRSQAMTVGAKMSGTVHATNDANDATTNQNGASWQFVQNNYSPKALSRLEIYRQTKNQFSAFKEVVQQ